jgi:simple sugar transport system ATP-binding protein
MANFSVSDSEYPVLKLHNITKLFPGVVANDDISLQINNGEILAILGENGAGKSTLMKILSGLYQPDSGIIELDLDWFQGNGNSASSKRELIPIKISNPRTAINLGIGMVHQQFLLVETMNVAENIVLGKEITRGRTPILDQEQTKTEIKLLGDRYGLPINPLAIIEELPVGLRQRVEILKQLYRDAQLFIFDEPTAVLTPSEVEELFKTIRELKTAGKTIIFISHKLHEPLTIADRILVMRGGRLIGETTPADSSVESLAEMLVGRRVLLRMERRDISPGAPVLEVKNLNIKGVESQKEVGDRLDSYFVKNLSFSIREHEIVGVAGVQGNGQTEIIEGLMGLRKDMVGSVRYYPSSDKSKSEEMVGLPTLKVLEKGIAYIPEDRSVQGLIQEFPVYGNTWLGYQTQSKRAVSYLNSNKDDGETSEEDEEQKGIDSLLRKFFLPFSLMKRFALKLIERNEIATPNVEAILKNLSGGNQQKVILGREFAKNPRLIIASQPTRGVDIGVTERVRNSLLEMRDQGSGILLVSSDLDEILALSDFLLVIYEGKIVGSGRVEEFPTLRISKLMATGKDIDLSEQEAIS